MAGTTETSIMLALSELHRTEANRVAEEAAREAAIKKEIAEREKKEREQREQAELHRLRVAEAEARLRVAEELRVQEMLKRTARAEEELRAAHTEKAELSEHVSALLRQQMVKPQRRFLNLGAAAALCGIFATGFALAVKPPPPVPPPPAQLPTRPQRDPAIESELKRLRDTLDRLTQRSNDGMTSTARDIPTPKPVTHHPVYHTHPTVVSRPIDFEKCSRDPLGCIDAH